MQPKKLIGAAALTAMLAGGGVAGALIGVPSLSGAQTGTTTTAPAATDNAPPPAAGDRGHRGPRGGGAGLEAAAKALGTTAADLRTSLKGGKTIAEVAKEKGVDLNKVTDAMVAAETKAIDRRAADAKANLPERVKDQVNNTLPDRGGHGGFEGRRIGLDAASAALGVSADDLRTSLKDGKTIADVAKEKNVDVQKVIDAMVAEANKAIDQAVTDGKLTADQAATRKAKVVERITTVVNEGGRRHH